VTIHKAHLQTQSSEPKEYSVGTAKIIAQTITTMKHQFAQTFCLMKSIEEFGEKNAKLLTKK
jgi:hypothetical protein